MLKDLNISERLNKSFAPIAGINPNDISKQTYFVSTGDIFAAFRPFHICDMPLDDLLRKERGFGVLMLETVGNLKLSNGTYGIHLKPSEGIGVLTDRGGKTVATGKYEAVMPITASSAPTQSPEIDIEFSGKCSIGINLPLSLSVKCYGGAQSLGGGISVTTCHNLTIDLTPFIL